MQDIVEKEFVQETIIAVVHRFRYIHRFDRVVFLKYGEVMECDTPEVLLQSDSEFRRMYLASQRLACGL
jgi:ABC-type multidrug transport system fused ATPase/permease subunit